MSSHPPASFGPQRTEQQGRAGLLHPTLSPGHSLRSGLPQTDVRKMFCILFPTEQCFFSFPTKGIFHHKKQSTSCELMRQERRTWASCEGSGRGWADHEIFRGIFSKVAGHSKWVKIKSCFPEPTESETCSWGPGMMSHLGLHASAPARSVCLVLYSLLKLPSLKLSSVSCNYSPGQWTWGTWSG